MPKFNYSTNVNETKFKQFLDFTAYKLDESSTLSDEFSKAVIALMVERHERGTPTGCSNLIEQCGFITSQSIIDFLRDPAILRELNEKLGPPFLLPAELLTKIQSTYDEAKYLPPVDLLGRAYGLDTLSTLFPVFELIKNLSQDEIALLDKTYSSTLKPYLRNNSLLTFHNDLKTMPLLKFEEKYEGCFNGMLDNVIGCILDTQKLSAMRDNATKLAPLNEFVKIIDNKIKQFELARNSDALDAAWDLRLKIDSAINDFIAGEFTINELVETCNTAISDSTTELSKHRGWPGIFSAITLIISNLASLWGKKTDSELILKEMKEAVDDLTQQETTPSPSQFKG
ncbi:hypothetical protein A8135_03005 [Legionella jamestowniensis]|uniref:Substrate of the Dot/Icm secretion system n=1 Tax=Legionella jamestowniensis TaxID=455 RepID=A0ABX2XS68_9GAMM|nr:hypothetical protein [Legionella jamestowniensis]OCH97459.1 hypothetical protein A8135_03005 [Legionella jamestowniensis]